MWEEAKKLYQKEFLSWFQLTRKINPLLKSFKEKEVDIPTLYVMGSEDYMFLSPVRQIVNLHKKSILKIIENGGHICNIERPNDFNAISLDFLVQQTV